MFSTCSLLMVSAVLTTLPSPVTSLALRVSCLSATNRKASSSVVGAVLVLLGVFKSVALMAVSAMAEVASINDKHNVLSLKIGSKFCFI